MLVDAVDAAAVVCFGLVGADSVQASVVRVLPAYQVVTHDVLALLPICSESPRLGVTSIFSNEKVSPSGLGVTSILFDEEISPSGLDVTTVFPVEEIGSDLA
jgi:hypothetical protein